MVTAVFPAAGQGRRMNVGMNKVFLELAGKPILVHTLLRFSSSAEIDNLVVVVAEEEVSFIRKLLSHVPGLKPFQVVAGSTERQYSIANGLAVVPEESDIVLVHDAARPLTSVATIDGVVKAAREIGGAVAAVPAKSTIKLVDDNGVVVKTPPRDKVWEVQTPQGFRKDLLLEAYRKAKEDGFLGTDDSSLVERLEVPVKVVASDYKNIKVTTPEDLLIAEMFLKDEADGLRNMVKSTLKKTKDRMKKHLQ
ncbi:2-C-methyl-D-erythritol 4-phosphate cytidylyltransferase [Selenomonas sp. GACV-9]|uniref:2-C-methyl-D-erythritol 4-phosphate cytidylyltransferase n=1 Tax=Selenomonas sp. GACV-9 TaxID=3158782 RepID=UPI0008E24779|nr:2-C-methyl-D-erythritol 4-phosphate cytidylyltransferase [Selenomonas ruminantium]